MLELFFYGFVLLLWCAFKGVFISWLFDNTDYIVSLFDYDKNDITI